MLVNFLRGEKIPKNSDVTLKKKRKIAKAHVMFDLA
jgi:hypothetical protein